MMLNKRIKELQHACIISLFIFSLILLIYNNGLCTVWYFYHNSYFVFDAFVLLGKSGRENK